MEQDIRKIHEEVYHFLSTSSEHGYYLKFTLRKSNRAGRLEQGYWFYGNENYLAVSFWSGMDWKNKTPNISFIILKDGRTLLDFSASDSEDKYYFIKNDVLPELKQLGYISQTSKGYVIMFNEYETDYIKSLSNFISNGKEIIDNTIRGSRIQLSKLIFFIEEREFYESLRKIESYRHPENNTKPNDTKLINLAGFCINNYGPIKDTGLIKIPEDTQWIFLTGENGTGKTSLLRALSSAICFTKIKDDSEEIPEITLILNDAKFNQTTYNRINNHDINRRKPITTGFCSYGASRLKTSAVSRSGFSIQKALSKEGLTSSLFNHDTVLIDIQDQLNFWEMNESLISITEQRKEYIREILVDILPNVYNIKFSKRGRWERTLYVEKDNNGKELPAVSFDHLASGLKSLIAMIGDMMMRLFNQQSNVSDPAELTGLVIIDEIDIHLHPKLQKYLVLQLTETFPKVQFIASTHSPIPLLGAPNNSCFFKIERNASSGVEITDLTEIKVQHLLPNAILTSDLFDMNNLFSRDPSIKGEIRTEDTFEEIIINKNTKSRLAKIAQAINKKKDNEKNQ